jgi:ABC-type uncharacterized transport system substrate-binding protein
MWAAETALKILNGTPPASIPITRNKEGKLIINAKLAQKMGLEIPYELIETADQTIE